MNRGFDDSAPVLADANAAYQISGIQFGKYCFQKFIGVEDCVHDGTSSRWVVHTCWLARVEGNASQAKKDFSQKAQFLTARD